jgi:hypothetical protein
MPAALSRGGIAANEQTYPAPVEGRQPPWYAWFMVDNGSPSSDNEPRVVNFRRGQGGARQPVAGPPPVEDLAKYERGEGADDYRHRMIVNAAAFLFVIALIGAGLWLADTMARMRKNQDCVLSGRRGCTPVEVSKDRW